MVYLSDYEIGSTISSGEANEDHDMMMVMPYLQKPYLISFAKAI